MDSDGCPQPGYCRTTGLLPFPSLLSPPLFAKFWKYLKISKESSLLIAAGQSVLDLSMFLDVLFSSLHQNISDLRFEAKGQIIRPSAFLLPLRSPGERRNAESDFSALGCIFLLSKMRVLVFNRFPASLVAHDFTFF